MGVDIYIPDFLKESADDIHSRMLKQAPENVSTIEGDIFWDATRPSAEEFARIKNIALLNVLKSVIIQTTTEEYLDLKGSENGLTRKQATKAMQAIKFMGTPGTIIASGKIISTKSTEDSEAVQFEIIETNSINKDGTVTVNAECLEAGAVGNVSEGNITVLVTPINGIKEISNIEIVKAGVDVESDDDFRERIIQKIQMPSTSGNKYHYLNWALAVDGVGAAKVFPLVNGPGTVKVVIADSNKKAASSDLVEKTAAYIEELRPIGATVTVTSAIEKTLKITANITIVDGLNLGNVKVEFDGLITEYLKEAAFKTSSISIAKIGNILLNTTGVLDYQDLKVNGLTSNISLTDEEIPVLEATELGVV